VSEQQTAVGDRPTVIVGQDLTPDMAAAIRNMGIDIDVRSAENTENNGWSAPRTASRIIVVVSPKGGSGKTAVASNLAVALSQRHPGQVVAVDLDVQFGDLGTALALQPERNLAQLALTSELNATTAKLFLTPYDDLFVLAGADNPVEADVVTPAHISAVLPLLAQEFAYVVVDTPAGLDERTLAALEGATDLLAVSSMDVSSIKSLRKALDTLDRIGVNPTRTFALNRCDAKVALDTADAEEAVGMKAAVRIPSSRDVPTALNIGTPVVKSMPRAEVSKRFQQLAQLFAPSTEVAKQKRGWRR
jgi:pilus assembly protein CpaE